MVFGAFFKRRFSCLEDIIELILCTVPLIVFVIIVWSIFSLIP